MDESMPVQPLDIVKWRPLHEEKVLKATSQTLRTVVLRPGVVYGGTGGLMATLFASAQNGAVEIVGEGHNRWPMVHVQDLAYAYVSAAEKELSHVILNVVDDSTATLREMAEAIAQAAKIDEKVTVVQGDEAQKRLGPLIEGLQIDLKVNNSRIKRLLGWQIHHAPFIYEAELYYHTWQSNQKVQEF
jgi:nucleoside-diphosphate-sugar epimerase